jgi:hypothetical protein
MDYRQEGWGGPVVFKEKERNWDFFLVFFLFLLCFC